MESAPSITAIRLELIRLVLEPLQTEHADELAPVLDDASLHRFIGREPLSVDELRARFDRQTRGWSPDGRERWLNWMVRQGATDRAIGTVQATVTRREPATVAELAWVIGSSFQRQGFAKEAVQLVAAWLREQGVGCLRAHIHPRHDASMAVARSIGLRPTGVMVDGEIRWDSQGA